MSGEINFRFQLGDKVNIIDLNYDDQAPDGYQIIHRGVRRGQPSYKLAGAFFPELNFVNVFFEQQLLFTQDLLALIDELHQPWNSFDDDNFDLISSDKENDPHFLNVK